MLADGAHTSHRGQQGPAHAPGGQETLPGHQADKAATPVPNQAASSLKGRQRRREVAQVAVRGRKKVTARSARSRRAVPNRGAKTSFPFQAMSAMAGMMISFYGRFAKRP